MMPLTTRQRFSLLCIGACGTFWLLTLIGTIPWSFRWYALAVLVSLCALREAWLLIRPRDARPRASRARMALRTGAVVVLVFIAVTPALIFPPYARPEPTGAYAVATVLATWTDESRMEAYGSARAHRHVNVEFWYPQDADDVFPLVIFSHGGLGIRRSNATLYEELASHGYVVGSIGHPYHAFWTQDVQGRLTFLSRDYFGELTREDAQRDKQQSYTYYQRWMDTRMRDINFVIDTVLTSTTARAPGESAESGVSGILGVSDLVDHDRIGVMGHSLGGSAALGIGRQRRDIGAVMALEAPFMADIVGVDGDEFVFVDEAYPAPVLSVYSDSSWDHLSEWPQYARNAALLSDPPPHSFSVHIPGVGHLGLTDLALSSPLLVRLFDGRLATAKSTEALHIINRVTLEFFDRYLKSRA